MSIKFKKALEVLDKILQGKTPKEIVYELDVSRSRITEVKKMFPLFAGLTQRYDKHD